MLSLGLLQKQITKQPTIVTDVLLRINDAEGDCLCVHLNSPEILRGKKIGVGEIWQIHSKSKSQKMQLKHSMNMHALLALGHWPSTIAKTRKMSRQFNL